MPTNTTAARSVGDKVQVAIALTASSSTGASDSDVTFIVRTPAGVVTSAVNTSTGSANGITRSTVGSYSYQFLTTAAGDYQWWFRSTGTVLSSTGGRVAVYAPFAST